MATTVHHFSAQVSYERAVVARAAAVASRRSVADVGDAGDVESSRSNPGGGDVPSGGDRGWEGCGATAAAGCWSDA